MTEEQGPKYVRVYKFALLEPTENAELVQQQMWLAHKYQNKLVELERGRRAAVRRAMSAAGDVAQLEAAAADAKAKLEALEDTLRRMRKDKIPVSKELRVHRDALRLNRTETSKAAGEARKKVRQDPVVQAELAKVNTEHSEMHKKERAECGVYWGTYLIAEASVEAARKMPLYDGIEPNDPRFRRWTGDGLVSVLVPNGQPAAWLRTPNTTLRLEPRDPYVDRRRPGSKRSRKERLTLAMRISSEGRAPIWCRWPIILHRPLPAHAQIKRAVVTFTNHGPKTDHAVHREWYVSFTVTSDQPFEERPAPRVGGTVGIDLGWRTEEPGRVRIATLALGPDAVEHIYLDPSIASGVAKADELRATRAQNFNDMLAKLVTAPTELTLDPPAWWPTTLPQWRSAERLHKLIEHWVKWTEPGAPVPKSELAWFAGTEALLEEARAWALQDSHLWAWEAGQRLKTLRRRKNLYRCLARTLANDFQRVALPNFNLAGVKERAAGAHDLTRSTQFIVAPGELRMAIQNAFGPERTLLIDGVDLTSTCHVCGAVTPFEDAVKKEHIELTCGGCGAVWDQDRNAAINLQRRGAEAVEVALVARAAPKWKRAKAGKQAVAP